MKIDKKNGTCLYNDESHIYWDEEDNVKYISTTTLIHKFQQPYDSDFWSSYKALEFLMGYDFSLVKANLLKSKKFNSNLLKTYEINEDEFIDEKNKILKDWEDNKNNSCIRGTSIHLEKEMEFYKNSNKKYNLKKYGLGGEFICEKDYYELNLEKGIYPEYLVYYKDGNLRIAGQIDLLIKDGNDIIIIDYKTNKKLNHTSFFDQKTKRYETMKYPLDNIMDCNMMHYTLQLSMYAYLIQKINPDFNIKLLKIIHTDHDNNEHEFVLDYKKNEIERIIKFYKKEITEINRKNKNKPIEY